MIWSVVVNVGYENSLEKCDESKASEASSGDISVCKNCTCILTTNLRIKVSLLITLYTLTLSGLGILPTWKDWGTKRKRRSG